ncbi:MAG TPA: hypothetical protein P5080_01245 [Candidatus Paceibacterota bacterium]|nr:hypothetical protein [Candidatus Pacearchaeota archaeon]HRZ50598.1 hypothetical protein [Candidatus Paceibacterota bacterium]HSA36319.1 hypothetical protein [Candidatus Paceibacterota bacterium]
MESKPAAWMYILCAYEIFQLMAVAFLPVVLLDISFDPLQIALIVASTICTIGALMVIWDNPFNQEILGLGGSLAELNSLVCLFTAGVFGIEFLKNVVGHITPMIFLPAGAVCLLFLSSWFWRNKIKNISHHPL